MADLDYEAAQMIYTAYAIENEEYGQVIGNFASYKVPLVDMFLYVCDEADTGIVSLSQEDLDDLHAPATRWRAHWPSCRATTTTASSST